LPGFALGASGAVAAGVVEVVDVDATGVCPPPEAVMPFGTVVALPELDEAVPPELFPPLLVGAVAVLVGVFDTTVVEVDEGTVVVVVVVVVVAVRDPSALTVCGVLMKKLLGVPDSVIPLPN
jgi:hypothetical protein